MAEQLAKNVAEGVANEVISTSSVQQCLDACEDRMWCKSVDYEKSNGTCYLQPVGMHDVALDHNYSGDPYDHYTCEGR